MDEIAEHAWIISIVGDFLTVFGAFWTAREYCSPQGKRRRLLSEDGTTSH